MLFLLKICLIFLYSLSLQAHNLLLSPPSVIDDKEIEQIISTLPLEMNWEGKNPAHGNKWHFRCDYKKNKPIFSLLFFDTLPSPLSGEDVHKFKKYTIHGKNVWIYSQGLPSDIIAAHGLPTSLEDAMGRVAVFVKFDKATTREVPKELQKALTRSTRISIFNQERSEIVYLSTDQLIPYQKQARKIFDDIEIESLAQTISEHGIRQPLTVLRVNGDPVKFEVISGERRLRAAKLINLSKIPCIIINDSDKAEEIAVIENIHRQDLHPIELANALNLLIEKIGWGGQSELEKKWHCRICCLSS